MILQTDAFSLVGTNIHDEGTQLRVIDVVVDLDEDVDGGDSKDLLVKEERR